MRRLTLTIIVLSITALVLGGCGDGNESPSPPAGKQVHLLVRVDGMIRLKRENWNDYAPVGFGALLKPTDLVEVDGSAVLLCADMSVEQVTGPGRQPCPVEGGWLEYNGGRFDSGQRGSGSEVPYILYPRSTLVLDPRPLLRWNATGAGGYTVSIVSGGEEVWSQSGVGGGELEYPDDAPDLQPGNDYLLVVQSDDTGASSQEDPARGLGFRVVGEAERAAIEARRDEILALDSLDEPARHLALAIYYAGLDLDGGRGLWGDAWLLLESVARAQNAPAVQLLLGDMLAATKLPDEAQTAYQAALQAADALGDVESQAAAHVGLWRVTGDAGHRDRAVELYEGLGDEAAVGGLAE